MTYVFTALSVILKADSDKDAVQKLTELLSPERGVLAWQTGAYYSHMFEFKNHDLHG